ncbi:NepR family anti-sigma factor [Roseicyclus sp. F158]|uniref:NepR family anti-sigma factor n=1 Tax=Tropicimonas omnivorans TaxID=3075590 RepID=A0ABU3DFR3_9RHOB|nr:NepR family anti-sigma factor [Roseicyclus sp. F158]MDT0682530.1 NepR family anti-sigma factor [Roseicyclus sp. F158]
MSEKKRSAADLDTNLRRVFQQKVDEDLPDRFTSLLQSLRAQDEAAASGPSAAGGRDAPPGEDESE